MELRHRHGWYLFLKKLIIRLHEERYVLNELHLFHEFLTRIPSIVEHVYISHNSFPDEFDESLAQASTVLTLEIIRQFLLVRVTAEIATSQYLIKTQSSFDRQQS